MLIILVIIKVQNSTVVNNAPLKWKAIEEQFGPISKSPLKIADGSSSVFDDQTQKMTIASRSLFDISKTLTSKAALPSSMGLVSLSKVVHGHIRELDGDSESDRNLALVVEVIKKHSDVPPRHNYRLSDKRMQTEMVGGDSILLPSIEKISCSGDGNRKQKKPMQPFAIYPPKREVRVKT